MEQVHGEPKTFIEAVPYFKDADNCLNYLVARRWPRGVMCPTCGRADVAFLPSRRLWQCKTRHPKAQFSIKTGTILEDSPLGLDKWLPVIWLIATCKNGIGSREIHRDLGVTQKTAWFMLHRVRLAMQDEAQGGKIGGPGCEVEIDENFIGGKGRNMHYAKKMRVQTHGRNTGGKTVVLGMLERGRTVRAQVIADRTKPSMQPVILKWSTIWKRMFKGTSTQDGIENFWFLLKRGIGGTYFSVELFHLHRYVD